MSSHIMIVILSLYNLVRIIINLSVPFLCKLCSFRIMISSSSLILHPFLNIVRYWGC